MAAVSVVVPTHARTESLACCLGALARQSLSEPYEIVVVDDASPDEAAVAAVVASHERARLVRLPRRAGPGAARNAGARAAVGSFVLFTDDDCEPGPAWAAALVERLRGGARIVAGATEDGAAGNAWTAASHLITVYFTEHAAGSFAASNNIACTAGVLAAIPFDESFPDAAGEDRDWCSRVAEAGLEIEPVPAARLEHHHRLTLRTFCRRQFRYGRGAYRFHRGTPAGRPLERPQFYAGLLRRGFEQGPGVALLVVGSQAAVALGFLVEAISARRRVGRVESAADE